jgi:lantibiotic modifying enzyme
MSSEGRPFLDVAGDLARGIAASAVWHDGRCNWMGARPREGAGGSVAVASLGADLYGGTSGVSLFLAEAGTRLDDDRVRRAALGAIRHALDHAAGIDPEHGDGLYLGPIGVAYAAARVAALLDSAPAMTRARELLRAWSRDDARSASADVMSGCAGAVAGLVALSELVQEPWLLDAAARLGEELMGRAEVTAAGWSWALPGRHTMHHLCGVSHGAAGIGHALTELFGVTGEGRFRAAAERAFDYERSWLDPATGTWPDLRDVGRRAGRDAPMPTADSWCNGAAGIALSRLRAAELLGSEVLRHEAELALVRCEQSVAERLAYAPSDYSLCHGAAGIGDVLLYAADGPEDPRARLAAEIGLRGIEHHHGSGAARFPCGLPQGDTPCLFLGFAGIGMFYLRLADRGVASPLLVRRLGP